MEELNLHSSGDGGNLFSLLMLTRCFPNLITCTLSDAEVPNNFLRVGFVDVQLKVNKMGRFFHQIPLTRPCQISWWSTSNPSLSLLSLSKMEHVISTDDLHLLFSISPELRCSGGSCGWGLFCWEKLFPLTVLCEHWPTIRRLTQISANTFYFQKPEAQREQQTAIY